MVEAPTPYLLTIKVSIFLLSILPNIESFQRSNNFESNNEVAFPGCVIGLILCKGEDFLYGSNVMDQSVQNFVKKIKTQ